MTGDRRNISKNPLEIVTLFINSKSSGNLLGQTMVKATVLSLLHPKHDDIILTGLNLLNRTTLSLRVAFLLITRYSLLIVNLLVIFQTLLVTFDNLLVAALSTCYSLQPYSLYRTYSLQFFSQDRHNCQ